MDGSAPTGGADPDQPEDAARADILGDLDDKEKGAGDAELDAFE